MGKIFIGGFTPCIASDHTRSQFEKMLGLASVKEALAFIEANQPEAIEEQKELVLIEAPTGHEENRAKVFAEKFKALGLEDVHTDRGGNVMASAAEQERAEGADRGAIWIPYSPLGL